MAIKKISVLIPAYNEEATITQIIQKVKDVSLSHLEKEIIVVENGSTDRTREILKRMEGIQCIFFDKNRGKGGALKAAMAQASGEVLLIQDADLEYDPGDYPVLLKPILEGEVEFVMGSRFLKEKPKYFVKGGSFYFSHYIGNRFIIWMTNLLYGQRNTDYESCYKVFTRKLALSIPVATDHFAFDNELICKSLRRGYHILEVPVRYDPRHYSEGKKVIWSDGLIMLWTILKWRILPF